MDEKKDDLYGNAPDSSPVALLIIDLINDLEFPGGAELLESARLIARTIVELKQQAKVLQIPVIYVNDNFGRWQQPLANVSSA